MLKSPVEMTHTVFPKDLCSNCKAEVGKKTNIISFPYINKS